MYSHPCTVHCPFINSVAASHMADQQQTKNHYEPIIFSITTTSLMKCRVSCPFIKEYLHFIQHWCAVCTLLFSVCSLILITLRDFVDSEILVTKVYRKTLKFIFSARSKKCFLCVSHFHLVKYIYVSTSCSLQLKQAMCNLV
jgi:hypothetical protein